MLGINKQGIQADDQLFEIGANSLNICSNRHRRNECRRNR
ncbi:MULTISPECIES: hypothetical protein [Paenibacillus]